jgi:hypothetical protein
MKIVIFAVLAMFATAVYATQGIAPWHQKAHTEYVEAMAQAKADYTDARKACTPHAGKVHNDCITSAVAANRKTVLEAKAKHTKALKVGH